MSAEDTMDSKSTSFDGSEKQLNSSASFPDKSDDPAKEVREGFLVGWRFYLTIACVFAAQFLVQLEMSVVSTALVAINDDLEDFKHSTWTANAYFLTWSGFLVLWSQFSHTIGRKPSFLIALGLFIAFSAACAAAQTAIQLYIFRGLQGLAGAGIFSLPLVIVSEAVPGSQIPFIGACLALLSVISLALGPIAGGVITANVTWRWVFIIDIPLSVLVFLTILIALPGNFPHHNKPKDEQPRFKLSTLKQLDLLGGVLFLGMSFLLVTALQESGTTYAWHSAFTICMLTFSALSGLAFLFWERLVTLRVPKIMPVMTFEFMERRIIAMFASAFLIGALFLFTLVETPQRFQIVNQMSPLGAAVRVLPFTIFVPIGGLLAAMFQKGKFQDKPVYGQLIGSIIQLVAVICLTADSSTGVTTHHIPGQQYVFQILMGFGNGFAYVANSNGIFFVFGRRTHLIAPAVGLDAQFRYLGATVGLGAATAAFSTYAKSRLSEFLSADQVSYMLQSSQLQADLSAVDRTRVLQVFAAGFVLQWQIMCGFAGLLIVTVLFTY